MALYFGTDMLKAFKGTAFHDSLESLSQKIKAYLSDELLDLLRKQNFRREKDCPFVFHRAGKEIFDLRGSWKKACEEAGIPGKLFHDFRRRAVRNLTRSGTQETVAMLITGHKTRSVFDKYNITSQEAIKVAMQRQEEYLSRESVTIP